MRSGAAGRLGPGKLLGSLMATGILPQNEMAGKLCLQLEYVKRSFLNFSEQW